MPARVVFGGYVAFSVYLLAYMKTADGLDQADAARHTAGLVQHERRQGDTSPTTRRAKPPR